MYSKNEIEFNDLLEDRLIYLRKKLFKIGLSVTEIDFLGCYIKSVELDLINTEKYYKRFMEEYADLDFSTDIKEHEDFKEYNYTVEEFLKEELENTFNDPYNRDIYKSRDQDINTLNNDLINEITIKCVNYLNKDFNRDNPNPIKVIFMA